MKNSTFTILTSFALFLLIGLALLPHLEVSLLPNRSKPTITVTYSMSSASGEVIDAEITTPMEGVLYFPLVCNEWAKGSCIYNAIK